jgi:hypothetical protein
MLHEVDFYCFRQRFGCESLYVCVGFFSASSFFLFLHDSDSAALLMNLSLRSLGKRRAERLNILPTLCDLLEYEKDQVRCICLTSVGREYIHGMMIQAKHIVFTLGDVCDRI